LFSEVRVDPKVSVKLTSPVGTFEVSPDVVSDTMAVRVTVCPIINEEGMADTVVAVVSAGSKGAPRTETCCAL
jgi:hypothetical protein